MGCDRTRIGVLSNLTPAAVHTIPVIYSALDFFPSLFHQFLWGVVELTD